MICCEDYELAYVLYNEGKILEATNDMLALKSLTESSEVITEGFKENLKAYIDKIIAAIQAVWNKFKDNIQKAKLNWKEEDIQNAINNSPVNVQVENYVKYDPSYIDKITIQELNYGTMKESLSSKEDFLKRYYNTFYTDSAKSVADNIKAKCITQRSDKYNLTKDDLQDMFDYMKEHKKKIDKIGKDLQAVNKASRNAQSIVTTVVPTGGTPSNESTIEYYLSEADDAPKASSTDNSTTGTATGAGEANKDQSKEDLARVQNYFKATTEILSAEMSICREIYKYYDSCINIHMKNSKANKKETKKGEAPAQGNTGGGSDQVNI